MSRWSTRCSAGAGASPSTPSPDGATCAPTGDAGRVTLPVAALGAAWLGGTDLRHVAAGGAVDEHARRRRPPRRPAPLAPDPLVLHRLLTAATAASTIDGSLYVGRCAAMLAAVRTAVRVRAWGGRPRCGGAAGGGRWRGSRPARRRRAPGPARCRRRRRAPRRRATSGAAAPPTRPRRRPTPGRGPRPAGSAARAPAATLVVGSRPGSPSMRGPDDRVLGHGGSAGGAGRRSASPTARARPGEQRHGLLGGPVAGGEQLLVEVEEGDGGDRRGRQPVQHGLGADGDAGVGGIAVGRRSPRRRARRRGPRAPPAPGSRPARRFLNRPPPQARHTGGRSGPHAQAHEDARLGLGDGGAAALAVGDRAAGATQASSRDRPSRLSTQTTRRRRPSRSAVASRGESRPARAGPRRARSTTSTSGQPVALAGRRPRARRRRGRARVGTGDTSGHGTPARPARSTATSRACQVGACSDCSASSCSSRTRIDRRAASGIGAHTATRVPMTLASPRRGRAAQSATGDVAGEQGDPVALPSQAGGEPRGQCRRRARRRSPGPAATASATSGQPVGRRAAAAGPPAPARRPGRRRSAPAPRRGRPPPAVTRSRSRWTQRPAHRHAAQRGQVDDLGRRALRGAPWHRLAGSTPAAGSSAQLDHPAPDAPAVQLDAHDRPDAHLVPERAPGPGSRRPARPPAGRARTRAINGDRSIRGRGPT